jgi:hypothetical protein
MKPNVISLTVAAAISCAAFASGASASATRFDVHPINPPRLAMQDVHPINPPRFATQDVHPINPPRFAMQDVHPINPPRAQ